MIALLFPANLLAADINYQSICKVIAVQNSDSDKVRYNGGTGFVYNEDNEYYYIMTNGHVLADTHSPAASFYKEGYVTNLIPLEIVKYKFVRNTTQDVCVLTLDKKKAPFEITPLNMYDSDKNGALNKELPIIGAGYPSGYWLQSWYCHRSSRKVTMNSLNLITMGPVPGQSGSPVMVDIDGTNYVIGLLTYKVGNKILPNQTIGGLIKIDYVKNVIQNKVEYIDEFEEDVNSISTIESVSVTEYKYYVIVDSMNNVVSYDIINNEMIPRFYTREDFGRVQLRPGDAFYPARLHKVCANGKFKKFLKRLGDRLPTINPPKQGPFSNKNLPPFNKPVPKPTPDPNANKQFKLWPDGSPKAEKKEPKNALDNKPTHAPKPDPNDPKTIEAQIKHAQEEQKRLSDNTLKAERELWAAKEAELKAKLNDVNKKEEPGFFGGIFQKVSSVSGQVLGTVSNAVGFSKEGVLLTLIGVAGPLLIPGVRQYAIAKGVSPVLIKGAEYAIRFGKYLVRKKHASKDSGDSDNSGYWQGDTGVPSDYTNVVSVEQDNILDISKNNSENNHDTVKITDYNKAEFKKIVEETQESKEVIPQSVKQYIDLRIKNGEKLQEMVLIGHLYHEAVIRLGNGELTAEDGGPLMGHASIYKAIQKWVRDEYIRKIPYQTSLSQDASSYLTAYRGWLYQQAVSMLEKGEFSVLNHTTAAKVIQEWVQESYYKKITRVI